MANETRTAQRLPQRQTQGRPVIRTAANRFDIREDLIPPGMTYQWCVQTVVGQEQTEAQINAEANGWTPVPPSRHPELVGRRGVEQKVIVRGGLMLCERAREITDEVREMDEVQARGAVATQLERLRLNGHRQAGRGIKTVYTPIADDPNPE